MSVRTAPVVRTAAGTEIDDALRRIRAENALPEGFPATVLREAEAAALTARADPGGDGEHIDLTGIPFVTIDPPGSTDLDQAVHLDRVTAPGETGFVVHYAIADVASFVSPGGAVDGDTRLRGQTVYTPDGRVPLHPPAIGDDAASLLPGVVRRAFVWSFDLDHAGVVTGVQLRRALVSSRERFDYERVQALHDAGSLPAPLVDLPVIGTLRQALERERGGASLTLPAEEIDRIDGSYVVERRAALAVEEWNAQISLMTGMAAAQIMLDAQVGLLRTMPPPSVEATQTLRRRASALGVDWPSDVPYGEFLRSLDTDRPEELAVMYAAGSLFRGAGYTAFAGEPPADVVQAAIAAPYAHTTAPIRRLVDRFVLVLCHAVANGLPIPDWVADALPQLPSIMSRTDRVAGTVERESRDVIEAAVLTSYIGAVLDGVVVSTSKTRSSVQLREPQLTIDVPQVIEAGTVVAVRIVATDITNGSIITAAERTGDDPFTHPAAPSGSGPTG